jgi:hypothetical protein
MLLYSLQMSFARFYLTRFRSNETVLRSRVTCIQVIARSGEEVAARVADGNYDPSKVLYDSRKVIRDLY